MWGNPWPIPYHLKKFQHYQFSVNQAFMGNKSLSQYLHFSSLFPCWLLPEIFHFRLEFFHIPPFFSPFPLWSRSFKENNAGQFCHSELTCMFHGAEKGHPQVSFFMKLGDHPHVPCPTKEGHGMEWHWPYLNKRVENEESRLYPSKRDGSVSMVSWVSGKDCERKIILFCTYVWEEDICLLTQNNRSLIK